jgi:hypothetical protein
MAGVLFTFFSPAAKMRPSGEPASSFASISSLTPRCEFLDDFVEGGEAIVLLRRVSRRSAISATAVMDAMIKNQMGQPAAATIVSLLQM